MRDKTEQASVGNDQVRAPKRMHDRIGQLFRDILAHYFEDEPGWRDTTLLAVVRCGLANLEDLCRRKVSGVNWGSFVEIPFPVEIDWSRVGNNEYRKLYLTSSGSDSDNIGTSIDEVISAWLPTCATLLMEELTNKVIIRKCGHHQVCLFPTSDLDLLKSLPRRRARAILARLREPFCIGTALVDEAEIKEGSFVSEAVASRLRRINSPQDLAFAVDVMGRRFAGTIALVIAPLTVDLDEKIAYYPVTIGLAWETVTPPRASLAVKRAFWKQLHASLDCRIEALSTWDPQFISTARTWKQSSVSGRRAAKRIEGVMSGRLLWSAVGHREFEEMVAEIYAGLGYHVRLTRAAKDGGRDVVADQQAPVRARTIIECKHYANSKVGIEPVRALLGVYTNEKPNKAVLITTSSFSDDARRFASANGTWLTLIDRTGLMELIGSYFKHAAIARIMSGSDNRRKRSIE